MYRDIYDNELIHINIYDKISPRSVEFVGKLGLTQES